MEVIFVRFVEMKLNAEKCLKCGSIRTRLIEASYPKAYECEECGHIFVKLSKALTDE
ncbi:MAG: hypothetical protein QW423_02975 [Candidatus Aenigmatarchaeota archaeon]